jgi:hypothetical protein
VVAAVVETLLAELAVELFLDDQDLETKDVVAIKISQPQALFRDQQTEVEAEAAVVHRVEY